MHNFLKNFKLLVFLYINIFKFKRSHTHMYTQILFSHICENSLIQFYRIQENHFISLSHA